jgi:hypothetical protein
MLPIAVDAVLLIVADAAGKHSGLQRLSDRSLDGRTLPAKLSDAMQAPATQPVGARRISSANLL